MSDETGSLLNAVRAEIERRRTDKEYQALDRAYRKSQMKERLREMYEPGQQEERGTNGKAGNSGQ